MALDVWREIFVTQWLRSHYLRFGQPHRLCHLITNRIQQPSFFLRVDIKRINYLKITGEPQPLLNKIAVRSDFLQDMGEGWAFLWVNYEHACHHVDQVETVSLTKRNQVLAYLKLIFIKRIPIIDFATTRNRRYDK